MSNKIIVVVVVLGIVLIGAYFGMDYFFADKLENLPFVDPKIIDSSHMITSITDDKTIIISSELTMENPNSISLSTGKLLDFEYILYADSEIIAEGKTQGIELDREGQFSIFLESELMLKELLQTFVYAYFVEEPTFYMELEIYLSFDDDRIKIKKLGPEEIPLTEIVKQKIIDKGIEFLESRAFELPLDILDRWEEYIPESLLSELRANIDSAVDDISSGTGILNPDFELSASSESITIEKGETGEVTLYLTSLDGFSGPVTLTVWTTRPLLIEPSISSPVTLTSETTLPIKLSIKVNYGVFPSVFNNVIITAKSGVLPEKSITIKVEVT